MEKKAKASAKAVKKPVEKKQPTPDVVIGKAVPLDILKPPKEDFVVFEIMRKDGTKEFYPFPKFKLVEFENSIYEWSEDKDYLFSVKIGKKIYPANKYYEANPHPQPEKQGLYPAAYVYKDYLLDGRALLQRLEVAAWDIKEWREGAKEHAITEFNFKWIIIAIVVVIVAVVAGVVLRGG